MASPDSKFDSGEETVDTTRLFLSKEVSQMTKEELYNELEVLRAQRTSKSKISRKRAKAERKATSLHEMENHIPEQYKAIYRKMTAAQKKAFLEQLGKIIKL